MRSTSPLPPPGAPYSQHDIGSRSSYLYISTPQPPHLPLASPPIPSPSPRSSPNHVLRFTNCRVVRSQSLVHGDLWVQEGKIVDPAKRFWEASALNEFAADETIDCHGLILAPGYIDIQINGAFGFDFTSPSVVDAGKDDEKKGEEGSLDDAVIQQGLTKVAKGLLRHGVTSFCPTIITSSPASYTSLLPHYKPRQGSASLGANILGIHCEGPFITKPGAHNPSLLLTAPVTTTALSSCYGSSNLPHIKIITVAPEITGMLDVIAYMHKHHPHIVLSSGHSSATYDTAYQASQCGVRLLTHLFNAMIPFTHRDPGIIGLIGSNDPSLSSLYYSLITDDIHTHHASVKIAYEAHRSGIIIITDAIAGLGLPLGTTHIANASVTIVPAGQDKRKAVLTGTDTLAGSIATMEECVKNFKAATRCSVVDAVYAASTHASAVLGMLESKGRLEVGCDADVILLDDDLTLHGVWLAGEQCWAHDDRITVTSA